MEKKKILVKKEALLIEKPTNGDYSCPNYIPPMKAAKILDAAGLKYDEDAVKKFTEVIENFGIEIANALKRKKIISKEDIVDAIINTEII